MPADLSHLFCLPCTSRAVDPDRRAPDKNLNRWHGTAPDRLRDLADRLRKRYKYKLGFHKNSLLRQSLCIPLPDTGSS